MADNDFLSTILSALQAGSSGQAPVQPPLAPDAQPQSDLDAKIAAAKAVQDAPNVPPEMSEPTSFSPSMPLPQELQGTSGSQQAQIQQARQQAEGEKEVSANALRPRPILYDLLASITGKNVGGPNIPGYQGPTKTQHFENFLGNFLTSLAAGLSKEGRGPGSAMRGAGAAMTAPYEQAVNQAQLNQQSQANQAQIQNERLKSQLTAAQIEQMKTSIPVQMPNGSVVFVPAKDAGHVLGSVAGAQGKVGAAQIAADNKLSVEEMKASFANGKVVKTLPAQDKDGNIGVMGYNAQGAPVGFMAGALPPSAYMPKTSTTTDYVQTDGGLMAVPKSTTTSPVLPSGASTLPQNIQNKISGAKTSQPQSPAQNNSGASQLPPQVQAARNRSKGGAQQVLGPDGKPIFGVGGPAQVSGEDSFGNPIGKTEAGLTLNRKELDSAQKTFNKDYVEDINKLAKTQSEFESIRDNPNQTGAEKVTALLAAVGISGNALRGNGFRISQQVIDEHANARNIWQGFAQKWNKIAGSGGPITESQIRDYTNIAQGVVHDSYVQAAREARRQGLPVDFLPKPTKQNQRADDLTLRIYADSANGDVQKAQKALLAAGWR